MEPSLLAALVGLALVDSTSFGTLVLPLAMLARPRVLTARVLLYLFTLAAFYWLLGVALVLTLTPLLGALSSLGESHGSHWAQLVLGVALVAVSFWPDTPWAKRRARNAAATGGQQSGWPPH